MSKHTNIQWCHSTVNPVMGCDGCELWPPAAKVRAALAKALQTPEEEDPAPLLTTISRIAGNRVTSKIYVDRAVIAQALRAELGLSMGVERVISLAIETACKCYAGRLGTMRASHSGHASVFEQPECFVGRMAAAARWDQLTAGETASKPWLGKRRCIFISDMGDALSANVDFAFLRAEIIHNVASVPGRRSWWMWLTKRPTRMAEFGQWLAAQGIPWPENLIAMTTVTSAKTIDRARALVQVPCRFRALSLEPLFEPVQLPLAGIDWVIVGGGSDTHAAPFQVEWALDLARQCRKAEVAFFLKQLGRNPQFEGKPIDLSDHHGGDWNGWKPGWRIREVPKAFDPGAAEAGASALANQAAVPSHTATAAKKAWATIHARYSREDISERARVAAKKAWRTMRARGAKQKPGD